MPQKKRLKSISPEDAAISNYLMQSNRDKNFVQRAYNNNYAPRLQTNTIPGYSNKPDNMYSTELMSYDPGSQRVYPEIVQRSGQKGLEYLGGDKAWDYADSTGEYISMPPSEKVMDMFSEYGYKHASGIPIYKEGGSINTNTMSTKKDRYQQVGPRDWMNRNGWYAERGGYKPSQGVLPQVMPGMYPGNIPMVMNQHATEPMYIDIPAYEYGGFYQRPGYFYNGHDMVKNKGTGTYSQDGYYFERGGYPHPLDTPFDTFQMGGTYPHPLDMPFDEFKKGGIHIKPENRGKFNALKKRTGKTTEELTHSKNPLTRKRAIFAQNAAKWKHETGGMVNPFHPIHQYADGGPYDEDGGVSLPSANNVWGSSASNSEQQMSDAYGPVDQANQDAMKMDDNSYNNRPTVTDPRANMNETPVDASGFNNPYQVQPAQEENTPSRPKRNGFLNWGSAILGAGTGILGAASILHDKYQNRKVQAQWLRDQNKSANLPTYINPMAHGTYDQQGNIPYNNMSQSPNIRTMQTGGYVKGSTHELSEAEINALIKKGYKLQRI